MKTYFFAICLILGVFSGFAQKPIPDKEYELQYKKAVQLYATQNYTEMRTILFPLTHRRNTSTFVPYALYYYALASVKAKKHFDARLMLRQLIERYPDWKKIDEAYYLLANACLPDQYFEEGVSYLQRIENPTMKEDKLNLLYHYAAQMGDLEQTKRLQKMYPNEDGIALALIEKIQTQPNASKADLTLSDELVNRFGLGKRISSVPKAQTPVRETRTFQMAFLLPFKLGDAAAAANNQYIYDLYDGARWAKNKLQAEGININLLAFDVDKSAEAALELLNAGQLEQTDLLVGPLYVESNKVVSNFANERGVILINPLSTNRQLVSEQSSVYLAQASHEGQSEQIESFVSTLNRPKTANIYFSGLRKDSTLAANYKDYLQQNGYRIIEYKKVANTDQILQLGNVGHIFVSASDDNLGNKIATQLDKKRLNIPILGSYSAFDFDNSVSLSNKSVYVVYPEYTDKQRREVQLFTEQYFQKRHKTATYHTLLGYDMMLYYGRILGKYGRASFRMGLDLRPDNEGLLLSGFDYSNGAFENKVVPIFSYKEGEFESVN